MILALGKNGQLAKEFQKNNQREILYLSSTEIDLRCLDSIKFKLEQYHPKIVLNFTAYNFVDQAEENRDNELINSLAVKEIAEYCNAKNILLIHISTDYVFDGLKGNYTETDSVNPINAYGQAKLSGENFIRGICKKYFILRTSWLYSLYGINFLTTIIDLHNNKKNFKGADDLIGTPTSARSLAGAINHLIQNTNIEYGTYHFANTGMTSKYSFLKAIVDRLSQDKNMEQKDILRVKNEDFKMTAKRPYNTSLNSKKFTHNCDYKIPTWEEELHSIMDQI